MTARRRTRPHPPAATGCVRSARSGIVRRRRPDEGYLTMIEVVVTLLLTGLVLGLVTPLVQTVQGSFAASRQALAAEAQARLAVMNLTRQVTGAAAVCLPAQFTPTGFTLRVLAVVSTTTSGSTLTTTYRWEQWRVVTSSHVLEEEVSATTTSPRAPVSWPSSGGNPLWTTVARNVANTASGPFSLAASAHGSPQQLSVQLQVTGGGTPHQTFLVSSQVAALNTPYLANPPACTTLTPAQ